MFYKLEKSGVGAMAQNGHVTLLSNLVLGTKAIETVEDANARRILEELIHDFDPEIGYKVVHEDTEETRTPWLFASHGVYYGLSQIEGFVRQERKLRA